jgi:UDP-GlcNAc:undecaprenyl-phosphate/decaprenyl-phosphate GlcNAc-1-phosphate transferase
MDYTIVFISTLILSVILTGVVRIFSLKNNLVVAPRSRDSHKKPLPRIGGLAIFLAFLLVSIVYFLLVNPTANISDGFWFGVDKKIVSIWLASAIIVAIMLIDDLRGLSAPIKLFAQVVAVAVVVASGIGIDYFPNPFGQAINLNTVYIPLTIFGTVYHFSLWSDILTLVWLVGMMNVVNFIDGVDGLAAGISGIAAVTLFLLSLTVGQGAVAMIAIILAGSVFGFLTWNFHPAKIFMGDSGSMFLGLMLGVLPLISGGKLATAFLVLGFAIVDGLIVAGARILRGKNPLTTPDKTHLHHRFLAAGFSVRQAVLSMYLIAALFGWVALRSTTLNKIIASTILIFFVGALIVALNEIKKRKTLAK